MPDTMIPNRHRAFLRAVAAGRGTLSCSCEPDLFIDGLSCGDQPLAHQLVRIGLIMAEQDNPSTTARVPAALTPAGVLTLEGR